MSLDQLLSRGSPNAKEVSAVIPKAGTSLLASLTNSARKRNQRSLVSALLSDAGAVPSSGLAESAIAPRHDKTSSINGGTLAQLLEEASTPVVSGNDAPSLGGTSSKVASAVPASASRSALARSPAPAVPAATPASHLRVRQGADNENESSRTNSVVTLPDSKFPEASLWEQSLRSSLWTREPRAQSIETLRSLSQSSARKSSVTLAAGINLPATLTPMVEHHGSDAEGNRKARERNRAISRTVQAAQIALRNAGVAGTDMYVVTRNWNVW